MYGDYELTCGVTSMRPSSKQQDLSLQYRCLATPLRAAAVEYYLKNIIHSRYIHINETQSNAYDLILYIVSLIAVMEREVSHVIRVLQVQLPPTRAQTLQY